MWKPIENIVCIEFGSDVWKTYTPMEFLKKKKCTLQDRNRASITQLDRNTKEIGFKKFAVQCYGGLVDAHIELLREGLEENGIYLPIVFCDYDPNLPPEIYRLHIGFETWEANHFTQKNFLELLGSVIGAYQLSGHSKIDIRNLLDRGIELLSRQEYQEAMECFQLSYFWSSLNDSLMIEKIHAVNNMALIHVLNGRRDFSIYMLSEAIKLCDLGAFHDPLLRYLTANNLGLALMNAGNHKEAHQVFEVACRNAMNVGDNNAIINALFNGCICVLMSGEYEQAAEGFEKLIAMVEQVFPEDKDYILRINRLCIMAYKASKEEYKEKFLEQLNKNQELQQELRMLGLKHLLVKTTLSLLLDGGKTYLGWKFKVYGNNYDIKKVIIGKEINANVIQNRFISE